MSRYQRRARSRSTAAAVARIGNSVNGRHGIGAVMGRGGLDELLQASVHALAGLALGGDERFEQPPQPWSRISAPYLPWSRWVPVARSPRETSSRRRAMTAFQTMRRRGRARQLEVDIPPERAEPHPLPPRAPARVPGPSRTRASVTVIHSGCRTISAA